MPKVMILNGPPRCGKDTGAIAVEKHFGSDICKHLKVSQPLKDYVTDVLGTPAYELEKTKDVIVKGMNSSYRDLQIHVYHQLSQVFGTDWLGKVLINKMKVYEQSYFILSDVGRNDDILPLLRHIPPSDILIVQIMREGCSFTGDIRSYVSGVSGVQIKPTINKKINSYCAEMIDFAGEFFAE